MGVVVHEVLVYTVREAFVEHDPCWSGCAAQHASGPGGQGSVLGFIAPSPRSQSSSLDLRTEGLCIASARRQLGGGLSAESRLTKP